MRGGLVQLESSWHAICERHEYPAAIRNTVGEFAAAAVLLSATLKFDGSLVIQAQGSGPLSLLVVECNSQRVIRATAKWGNVPESTSLRSLLGDGQLVITIDPGANMERYQGIVELVGDSVADALENYLRQSEQLKTRLWLAADESRAAGLLIQKLPGKEPSDDAWETAEQLGATVTADELLALPPDQLVYRLFHAEQVRLFDGEPIRFGCSCSRERVVNALRTLGYDEIRSIIREQGEVSVDCEFCGEHYRFDAVDAEQLFAATIINPSDNTTH